MSVDVIKKCPYCGALLVNSICDYCGTEIVFDKDKV